MTAMNKPNQIDDEIRKMRQKISELEEKKNMIQMLTPEQRVADYIHESMCHMNHIDCCSWHYEFKNGIAQWEEHAHKIYLDKAIALLSVEGMTEEKAIAVLDAL